MSNDVFNIAKWALGNDTGLSSKTLAMYYLGLDGEMHYPRDGADLGRCIRLIAIEPRIRVALGLLARKSKHWATIEKNWRELVSLYDNRDPSLHSRMKSLGL